MNRKLKVILSIPKTIWFNLRYLPILQALKLPVWIANNVRIKELHRGCIVLTGNIKIGLIRIGYHEADGVDNYAVHTILSVAKSGRLVFKHDAHIGQGAFISAHEDSEIAFGKNFAISGTTSIIASKGVTFGDDVQLSWNSQIMDSDAHKIYDDRHNWINPPKEIKIGNKTWIAANCIVMKGANIADNTIVASCSLVNRKFNDGNCIIGGQPAKVLKQIGGFEI